MNFLLLVMILSALSYGDEIPENLIQLDENYSNKVLLVEKATHRMFLYQLKDGEVSLEKTYSIASGKTTGNKLQSGDKKTPEGVYFLQEFFSKETLDKNFGDAAKIYGVGAFTLDYPSVFDKLAKKSGNGIWLHSTDDDTRVSKGRDSRGCVVATQADFLDVSRHIRLQRTPIIITQYVSFLSPKAQLHNKRKLKNFFISWSDAWKNKNFEEYISSYSPSHFKSSKGNFKTYRRYKRYIFAKDDTPEINFSDISILKYQNQAIISATQHYKSASINDSGRKKLYLQLDDQYRWKIISETWEPLSTELAANYFSQVD